jgi:hypothetical protein
MKKSKWFWWGFLPYFNFIAWMHAAIRLERDSYYWNAAFYAIPMTSSILLGAVEDELKLPKAFVEHLYNLGGIAGVVLWIAGIVHVLVKKNTVDRQIQAKDEKQGSQTTSAKQDLGSVQPVAIEKFSEFTETGGGP